MFIVFSSSARPVSLPADPAERAIDGFGWGAGGACGA